MRIYNKDSEKKKYVQEIEKFLKTSHMIHLADKDDEECKQKAREHIINSRLKTNSSDDLYGRIQDKVLELTMLYKTYQHILHPEQIADEWIYRLAEALQDNYSVVAEITYKGKQREVRLISWIVKKALVTDGTIVGKVSPSRKNRQKKEVKNGMNRSIS